MKLLITALAVVPPYVVLLLSLNACGGRAEQPTGAAAPYKPPPVIAWLECVECTDAELQAVVSLGERAVPELRDILVNGPSKARLEEHERSLRATYRRLKEYDRESAAQPVTVSEGEYVQDYQPKFIFLNRSRAARALGAIGSPSAQNSLNDALRTSLPTTLRREVERALKSSEAPRPR